MNPAQAHTQMNELRSNLKIIFGIDFSIDSIVDVTVCEQSMMDALQEKQEHIAKKAAEVRNIVADERIVDGLWIILAGLIECLGECDTHCEDKSMLLTQRLVLARIMFKHLENSKSKSSSPS